MAGGRPKGSGPRIPGRQIQEIKDGKRISPLDYMESVIADPGAEPRLRLEAAKAAAPYVHRRQPQDMTHASPDGGPVKLLTVFEGKE